MTLSEIQDLQKELRLYLQQCRSDNELRGTIVNRICHSINGESLQITSIVPLKGVFAKNQRVYRLATNITSICCVYKENIDKND